MDMFASDKPEPIVLTQNFVPWPPPERLERERGVIGFHLSGHPLDQYHELFERLRVQPWVDFDESISLGRGVRIFRPFRGSQFT